MLKKRNKLFLSLLATPFVAFPIVASVSCGSVDDFEYQVSRFDELAKYLENKVNNENQTELFYLLKAVQNANDSYKVVKERLAKKRDEGETFAAIEYEKWTATIKAKINQVNTQADLFRKEPTLARSDEFPVLGLYLYIYGINPREWNYVTEVSDLINEYVNTNIQSSKATELINNIANNLYVVSKFLNNQENIDAVFPNNPENKAQFDRINEEIKQKKYSHKILKDLQKKDEQEKFNEYNNMLLSQANLYSASLINNPKEAEYAPIIEKIKFILNYNLNMIAVVNYSINDIVRKIYSSFYKTYEFNELLDGEHTNIVKDNIIKKPLDTYREMSVQLSKVSLKEIDLTPYYDGRIDFETNEYVHQIDNYLDNKINELVAKREEEERKKQQAANSPSNEITAPAN
ncbi:hypothetical protein ACNF36_02390 [Mycoplasma sp. 4463]|uniref:hypothetical protein n=1 Tax=Mycoplasma sp. 4463 TaxID=3400998 RepID=UPI003AB0D515